MRRLQQWKAKEGNLSKMYSDKWNIYERNISCRISKQRMSQSPMIANPATRAGEPRGNSALKRIPAI